MAGSLGLPNDYDISCYNRLLLELNNKEYYNTLDIYHFLEDNDLDPEEIYNKKTMKKKMLQTVYDIFETLLGDIDIYRKIETEFANEGEAYRNIEKRLERLEKRINSISDDGGERSNITFLFHT